MAWKQTKNTKPGSGGAAVADDDRHWSSSQDRAMAEAFLNVAVDLAGEQERGDQQFTEELRMVRERVGFSSDGIPFLGGQLSQLAAEDRGWSSFNHEAEFDPYQNRQYVGRYVVEKYHQNPVCRNIINAYVHFTMGSGFAVSMETDAEQARFDDWAEEVHLQRVWKKWARETYLFGASPAMLFPLTWGDRAKNITAQRRMSARDGRRGKATAMRVVPDTKLWRVHTSGNDVGTVVAYEFQDGWLVAPQDVLLSTLDPIGLGQRGGSILTPVLEDVLRLDKLANSRFYLNLIRSRLPAVREVKGQRTAGQGANVRKLPPAGSVVTEYGGNKWVFPSHNVDAAGAKDDWRLLVLRIATGVSLPEYMTLMDASNSNLASTLVAESPTHNMFLGHQASFARLFKLHLRAMGWDNFTIAAPSIVARDMEKEARSVEIAVRSGVMSKRTGAARLGLDYDKELQNMQVDEDAANMGAAPLFPGMEPDDQDAQDDPDDAAE